MVRHLSTLLCAYAAIALLAACLSGPASAAEVLLLPGRCDVARGKLRLIPTPAEPEQAHAIVGQRSVRTIRWCGSAAEPACDEIVLHRFSIDCAGERVSWVSVAAALLGTRSIAARVDNGKLTLPPAKPSREQRRGAGDQASTCARRAFPVAPSHLGHGPSDAGECKARFGDDVPSTGVAFPAGFAPLAELGVRLAQAPVPGRAGSAQRVGHDASGVTAKPTTSAGSVAETDRAVDSSTLPDVEPTEAAPEIEPAGLTEAAHGAAQATQGAERPQRAEEANGNTAAPSREAVALQFAPNATDATNAAAARLSSLPNGYDGGRLTARPPEPLVLVATKSEPSAMPTGSTSTSTADAVPAPVTAQRAEPSTNVPAAEGSATARDGAPASRSREPEPPGLLDRLRASVDAAITEMRHSDFPLDGAGPSDAWTRIKSMTSRVVQTARTLVAELTTSLPPAASAAIGAIAAALAMVVLAVTRARRRAGARARVRTSRIEPAQLLTSPAPSLEGARQIEALCEQASLTVEGLAAAPPLREVLDTEIAMARDRLAGAVTAFAEGGEAARRAPAICRNIVRDLDRVMRIADSALASFGQVRAVVTPPATRAEAFAVLGINADSDAAIVKKLADALRMSWHPDHARDEMDRAQREARTKQINVALELIRAQRVVEPQLQRA